jgi:hypothetical protein
LYFDHNRFEEEDEIHVISQEARVKRKDTLLTVRSGILGVEVDLQSGQKQQLVYLLDYDCALQFAAEPVTDLKQVLDKLHGTIEQQFLSDVLLPTKEFMETGKWE